MFKGQDSYFLHITFSMSFKHISTGLLIGAAVRAV